MAEIGAQLRETRMRNRIDIAEVEAATKIRAKYLRALENEEWDLLPGPTFVKTFLRTYANYLGLDARLLVEEYRQRYERPSSQELTPFGTNLGGRRARPRRPLIAPWMVVVAGIAVLIAALIALGRWGPDRGNDPEQAAQRTATPTPAAKKSRKQRKRAAAAPRRVRLQIRATGPVSVCLETASGTPLIRNETLSAGQASHTFRGRRFRMSFGTGAAVMRVDGRSFDVSDSAPVGYELRAGGKPRRLPESGRPTCSG
jgi:cytoskeleton protein RodZ